MPSAPSESPRTVAVIGASGDRRKFGNKAVRAYAAGGWKVRPIHPHETEVEGWPACRSLAEVSEPIDAVTLYVPPPIGVRLLPEIAACRPREVWVNPGAESPAFQAAASALQLPVTYGCSILSLGRSPGEFPDR